jgi:hypothetical protein
MVSHMPAFARYILAASLLVFFALNVTAQAMPSVTVSPGKLEFSPQPVGQASAPQRLTLSNPGSSSVDIRGIQISGIDYSESNDCPDRLASEAKCSVDLTFKPAINGTRLGALQLAWSGSGSPRTIPLTGIGQ